MGKVTAKKNAGAKTNKHFVGKKSKSKDIKLKSKDVPVVAQSASSSRESLILREDPSNLIVDTSYIVERNPESKYARFEELPVNPLTKRAVQMEFKFDTMTDVQQQGIMPVLVGNDGFIRARTGTGKTLAFLIPAFEKVYTLDVNQRRSISVVVVAPVRELADQILKDAVTLNAHYRNMGMSILIGGKKKASTDVSVLSENQVDMIFGTPQRILEIALLKPQLFSQVKMLIFDEGDTLFDMGFREKIVQFKNLCPATAQTILYSATMPKDVLEFVQEHLRPSHFIVDTIGEVADQTDKKIEQFLVVTQWNKRLTMLEKVIRNHMKENPDYKVLAFFPTTKDCSFAAKVLNQFGLPGVGEMHSKLKQNERFRQSDAFRNNITRILLTSDVSARGLDYPDITLVIQLGFITKDQYVQRIGRTARAGKSGKGLCIVMEAEAPYVKKAIQGFADLKLLKLDADVQNLGFVSKSMELKVLAYKAYVSLLGYYMSKVGKKMNWDRDLRLQECNQYLHSVGLTCPPSLLARVAKKLGLFNDPLLKMIPNEKDLEMFLEKL